MIKTLVFHIGDPKNGSSSIQKAMQRRACRPEGVRYVSQPELNASPLALAMNPKRRTEEERQKLQQRLFAEKRQWAQDAEADIGLISSEFFVLVPPDKMLQALAQHWPEFAGQARFIAYVRPHASRFLSGYAQRTKDGSFLKPMAQFASFLDKRDNLRGGTRFGGWQDVFGERFTLRPFIRKEMCGGDVVEDFFSEVLQGAPFTLDKMPSTNESMTLEELAGVRFLQKTLWEHEIPKALHLPIGGALGRMLAAQSGRSDNKLRLARKLAERLQNTYRSDAELLDSRFFGKPLMVEALDDACRNTVDAPQPIAVEAYFGPEAVDGLRQLGANLANQLQKSPRAWRLSYKMWIGQRHAETAETPSRKTQENVDQVWALLKEITEILVQGRSR